MVSEDIFDLIVIGGGTAGLRTALYAASHDHRTALVDPGALGGTCLNTGCIPTKTMLYASHLYRQAQNVRPFGINVESVSVNFKALMNRVHTIIDEGQEHIAASIQNRNLNVIREKAVFVSKSTLKAGTRTLSAKKFIICTGAKPKIPPLKGIEKVDYLLSDDVLALQTLPSSLIVIGGGYIAMELATFFCDLGTKVTIIERNALVLKDLDTDFSELIQQEYLARGVTIQTNAEVLELAQEGKMKKIRYTVLGKEEQTAVAEELLVAAGRAPYTFGLNLEAAGVTIGERGNIEVNARLQTSNPAIYAIGDVIGKAPFAHAAKRESHIALVNALEGKKETLNFNVVPAAIFTSPPIASVGFSERDAKERKIRYGVLKAPFSRAGRATVIGNTLGFAKVIYEKKNKKIIGAAIIGPNADDLIHEFVALMNANGTIDDLRNTIHIHPTLAEVFEALKDVSE